MNEFDLQLGMNVYGEDEKCGRLVKAVVDPKTKKLTHIVVEDGFLRKEARVIPFENIVETSPERVDLSIGRSEIEGFEKYRQVNVEQTLPASEGGGIPVQGGSFGTPAVTTPGTRVREKVHEGISPRLVVLDRNTPVNSVDGSVGSLHHLLVDQETGAITRIVARRGALRQSLPMIGAGIIEDISEERVFVNALKDDLDLLPEYKAESPKSATQSAQEEDKRAGSERAAQSDLPLQQRIEMALAADPRTSDAVVDVIEERGVVTLRGEVIDPQTRDALQQVVAQVPGVLSVVNQLRFG